jgi:hypothetical protein
VIGTLGGVVITAIFGLLTAYATHRWQSQRVQLEGQLAGRREIYLDRRAVYVRYIVSAEEVFNMSWYLYLKNEKSPIDPKDFDRNTPPDLGELVTRNEALRVETVLLAGPLVQDALERYRTWLARFYLDAGSGTDVSSQREGSQLYNQLIAAMRDEVGDTRLTDPRESKLS